MKASEVKVGMRFAIGFSCVLSVLALLIGMASWQLQDSRNAIRFTENAPENRHHASRIPSALREPHARQHTSPQLLALFEVLAVSLGIGVSMFVSRRFLILSGEDQDHAGMRAQHIIDSIPADAIIAKAAHDAMEQTAAAPTADQEWPQAQTANVFRTRVAPSSTLIPVSGTLRPRNRTAGDA